MVTHSSGCQWYPAMAPGHPGPSSRIPITPGGFPSSSFFGCFFLWVFERGKFPFAMELLEETPAASSHRAFPRGNNINFFFPRPFPAVAVNNMKP